MKDKYTKFNKVMECTTRLNEMKEQFNQIMDTSLRVYNIRTIMGEESSSVSADDIQQLEEDSKSFRNELQAVTHEIITYYYNQKHLLGEWVHNRQCFCYIENGKEYVSYKGTNHIQVFGDREDNLPEQLIQSNYRINNLQAFNDVLKTGERVLVGNTGQ